MPVVSLTRRVQFTARHRYGRADWSEAQNADAFGPASMRSNHEHRYTCDVTVSGTLDEATGMLADLRTIDRLLQQHVLGPFDGTTLNDDVAEFAGGTAMPTCENLARVIARRLEGALCTTTPGVSLSRVTVVEDAALSATWDVAAG